MFRTIYNCLKRIGAVALAVAAAGCSVSELDDAEIPESLDEGYVAIGVSIPGVTRAETETDGEWTENAVRTLDFFFYESGAGENAAAVYTKGIAVNDATLVKDKTNTVKVPFDFKNCTAGSYRVIAVANWFDKDDSNPDMPEKPTIGELKAMITKADAKNNEGDDDRHAFRAADAPSDFVMTNLTQAVETVKINATQKTGSGKVNLKRIAAKIRVALDVVEKVTDSDGKEWTPDLKDMRLFINNGVRKARLDGGKTDLTYDAKDLAASDYYDILTQGSRETEDYGFARKLSLHQSHTEDSYKYYNDLPLYTYPCEWDESVSENHPTTLTIVVPWEKTENGKNTYRPTYYTVHVNNDYKIESNKYYYLRLHIGMMGSVTPEQPMEVEMECVIDEWGHAQNTDVDIRPIRYLIFSQTRYEMNNTTEIEIPIYSSHECNLSVTGYYYRYNDTVDGELGVEHKIKFGDAQNTNNKLYTAEIKGNVLKFTHYLFNAWTVSINGDNATGFSNTRSDEKLYSRIDIEITAEHKTNDNYKETIYLTLYPAIYIQTIYNTHDTDEPGRAGGDRGYVYVNGQDKDRDNLLGAYGVPEAGGSVLIVVTVTQFNETEKTQYEIGDPRTYFINNTLDDNSMKNDTADQIAPWVKANRNDDDYNAAPVVAPTFWGKYGNDWSNADGGDKADRTIRYYYPASANADHAKKVAPRLLMASGYSRHYQSMSRNVARRRCATYQEYGYPAGRWRVPTKAERDFFGNLDSKGLIPRLYHGSNVSNYHYASQTDDNSVYIRCVYDLWYWTNEDGSDNNIPLLPPYDISDKGAKENYKTFVWGDRPKQNPQETEVTDDADEPSVQSFLRQHGKGNYAVIEEANGRKKLEKLENLPMIEKPQMSN